MTSYPDTYQATYELCTKLIEQYEGESVAVLAPQSYDERLVHFLKRTFKNVTLIHQDQPDLRTYSRFIEHFPEMTHLLVDLTGAYRTTESFFCDMHREQRSLALPLEVTKEASGRSFNRLLPRNNWDCVLALGSIAAVVETYHNFCINLLKTLPCYMPGFEFGHNSDSLQISIMRSLSKLAAKILIIGDFGSLAQGTLATTPSQILTEATLDYMSELFDIEHRDSIENYNNQFVLFALKPKADKGDCKSNASGTAK